MGDLKTTLVRIEKRYKSICELLGWSLNAGSSNDRFLYHLVAEYEQARNHVVAKTRAIRDTCDHLDRVIVLDMPFLNSLGELQGSPAALEAAIGSFNAYRGLIDAFVKKHKEAK